MRSEVRTGWISRLLLPCLMGVALAGDMGFAVAVESTVLPYEEIPVLPRLASTIDLTAESDDLWDRIRNGFSMPDLQDELVLTHQQWYLSRPEYLRRMIERSRPYLHHIVSELERRGMPTELALLPMVESSYDPNAYSRAKAAGLWQFIPSTGKTYSLEQNWWEDERRDIVASTKAALDYLQTIYDMHGDWHLALASYNWGENAVARAITKNQNLGLATDFMSLTMPAETRHYVPKLQALKNIFANPVLSDQLRLPTIPNRRFFTQVTTPTPIDVKLAARLAGMNLKDFLILNPASNRPVIKDKNLLLPIDKVAQFEANLGKYSAPLQTWETYTLKRGEKLDKLAGRFGLPPAVIRRINSLPERSNGFPGQVLLLPGVHNRDSVESLQEWRVPDYGALANKRPAIGTAGTPSKSVVKPQNTGNLSGKSLSQVGTRGKSVGQSQSVQTSLPRQQTSKNRVQTR